jgi:hypothetical protein
MRKDNNGSVKYSPEQSQENFQQHHVKAVMGTPPTSVTRAARSSTCRCLLPPVPRRNRWAGIDSITTGLGWTKAADIVVVSGKPSKDDLEACWNLGATLAAQLME